MPTYSYRCANCGYQFDQYQSFTDDALTVCPNCGEPKLRKIFNNVGVTFNGSGFYHNDSKAPSEKKKSSDAKPAEKKSDSTPPPKAAPSSDSGSSSTS